MVQGVRYKLCFFKRFYRFILDFGPVYELVWSRIPHILSVSTPDMTEKSNLRK